MRGELGGACDEEEDRLMSEEEDDMTRVSERDECVRER